MQDGAIGFAFVAKDGGVGLFGDELQRVGLGPGFQQVFEGFADDFFGGGAAEFLEAVNFREVAVDEALAHGDFGPNGLAAGLTVGGGASRAMFGGS